MLNAEKYRDRVLKVCDTERDFAAKKTAKNALLFCACSTNNIVCEECFFNDGSDNISCGALKTKWLLSEFKEPVKLTQDEYNFLDLLGDGYLARGENGTLYIYDKKPQRLETTVLISGEEPKQSWSGGISVFVSNFKKIKDAFKFIKSDDEEPYNVKEMLSNYEIIDSKQDNEATEILNFGRPDKWAMVRK